MTTTDKAPATRARLGSAPDSWGVWFPDHPQQTTGTRFLDEIAEAGYHWMELGPYGFLPTDPSQLADELAARDLHVSAGTVGGAFHKKDELEALTQEALRVAKLAAAVGGKYLVLLPAMYRDLLSGDYLEDKTLDTEGWKQFIRSCEEVSRAVQQETGLRAVFHPPRRLPRRDPAADLPLAGRHRCRRGGPVPRHRPHRVRRRRQRRDHAPLPAAHRVHALQAG